MLAATASRLPGCARAQCAALQLRAVLALQLSPQALCAPLPVQVTGTVHETSRGEDSEAQRYGVPQAKGILK